MPVMEEPVPALSSDCTICKNPRRQVTVASKSHLPEASPCVFYVCDRCDKGDD